MDSCSLVTHRLRIPAMNIQMLFAARFNMRKIRCNNTAMVINLFSSTILSLYNSNMFTNIPTSSTAPPALPNAKIRYSTSNFIRHNVGFESSWSLEYDNVVVANRVVT